MIVVTIVAIALMILGVAFLVVAAAGFMRLPDVFCRLHVTGILDTLGAPLLLLGIAVWVAPSAPLVAGKLALGLLFLLMTSPLLGHLLSRAALESLRARPPDGELEMESTADPPEARSVGTSRP